MLKRDKIDWNEQLDPAETEEWEVITEILNNALVVDQKQLLDPRDVATACTLARLELKGKVKRSTDPDGNLIHVWQS